MADINLDDLLKSKRGETKDSLPVEVDAQVEAEKIERSLKELTPDERAKVEEIKDNIDLTKTDTALTYGVAAQKEIAAFSDSILSSVRAKDSGEVGTLLTELMGKVKAFEHPEDKSFLSRIPGIGKLVDKAEDMMASYDKLSVQVNRIQSDLENSKLRMLKDVKMFDGLYEKNLEYFRSLELYIRAGEEKLQEMEQVTLPKLRQQAQESADPMAVQVVSDFENSVERFSKKVHDLKLSKTIAIQTAPQIRLIQNNDKVLVDRVQTAVYHTIPLWKNQMVIALGLQRQQDVLGLQRTVNDATNELLKRNAAMLKQNTIETAKENERSIVDIETIRKVNDDLISTIEETVKIQQEGRAKRQAAEQELIAIEERLKNTLLEHSNRKMS